MKLIPLGQTDLTVSEFCMGTMTFGNETPEDDAHRQLDMMLDRGINFIDAAEMYPVNPITKETLGLTEEIIGRWITARGVRDRVIVATKITGADSSIIPDRAPITPDRMRAAVDASLARLQTEVIDVYQLHWPNRGSYHFRKSWGFDPSGQNKTETLTHMREILETAQGLIAAGKIRHIALSNETAWGSAQWLRLSEEAGLPRIASIQNEYSLLSRLFDTDMAELSVNEDLPLLAYSPLAAGLLTGKYAGDVTPEDTRRARSADLGGRVTPRVFEAVSGYLGIANHHGLAPVQMALAWTRTRPFVTIPIIGARTAEQLKTVLGAVDLTLAPEVLEDIEALHRAAPMPF
ncbi:aldo/keto reductase [Roseicitreum antarcticum]|uniref:Predicted oxidoreductase n=1 Tax=Roseicitreum antarcticum TaxID=564137 RepID=A0A1H2U3N6_9RHOB|nr:aldo/keto reductase [Roseicitreum antarcticum]SDW50558.1 Predicted oxidoreductase [Roseicitreum antarcticum]